MLRYVLMLALLVTVPAIARAERLSCPGAVTASGASASALDPLFDTLKRQSNPAAAGRVASRIVSAWTKSGSATVDLLLDKAEAAAAKGSQQVALDLLDRAIALAPSYAEGWNQRATLHYAMNRYDKSMADIACALLIEPRHFLAWSGMAAIYSELDMKQPAMEAWQKVLEIYPANREAQKAFMQLSEELADSPL